MSRSPCIVGFLVCVTGMSVSRSPRIVGFLVCVQRPEAGGGL